jgi:hypothetical protein
MQEDMIVQKTNKIITVKNLIKEITSVRLAFGVWHALQNDMSKIISNKNIFIIFLRVKRVDVNHFFA